MILLWSIFLTAVLAAAFTISAIGFLSTEQRGKFLPGLVFGIPSALLSLLVFVFCFQLGFYGFYSFAVILLVFSLVVIWRGCRTGEGRKDIVSAFLVSAAGVLVGFFLFLHPDLVNSIFFHFLQYGPIL